MPNAAELALVLKFRDQATAAAKAAFTGIGQAAQAAAKAAFTGIDQATAAAKAAFTGIGQAAQAAASIPRRAFEAFEGAVNKVNAAIRLTRRFLFELTLAMSPFLGALAVASRNNTVVAEQMQRLSRTFRDVATQIGIRLLPVLQAFADWFEKNAPRLIKWFEELPRHLARALLQIARMLAEIAQSIAAKVPEAAEAIASVATGLQRGARAARDFGREMQAAAGAANAAGNQVQSGIKIALVEAHDSLRNFGALAKDMTTGAIRGLQGSLETLFTGLITRSQSAKEAFKSFALGILQMIAQMIARFIAMAVILAALNFIPGFAAVASAADSAARASRAAQPAIRIGRLLDDNMQPISRHAGGLIPSYHSGGEVNALLEPGEFVMNRRSTAKHLTALQRMNAGGEGQPAVQNVFIINATDAQSFRGRIQESADVIESIFQRAMRRNSGAMREAVRI